MGGAHECAMDACGRAAYCRGWCRSHYDRWLRNGSPEPIQVQRPTTGECSVDGCAETDRAKGMCRKHYQEDYEAKVKAEECPVDDCTRPRQRRGLCMAHYERVRIHGSVSGGGPTRRVRGTGFGRRYYEGRRAATKAGGDSATPLLHFLLKEA